MLFLLWNNKKKEGALFGSLDGDPYGITEYIRDSAKEAGGFGRVNMMCRLFPENYEKPESAEPDAEKAGEENALKGEKQGETEQDQSLQETQTEQSEQSETEEGKSDGKGDKQ